MDRRSSTGAVISWVALLAAVALAALAFFLALRAERRVELDVSGDVPAGSPEAILERANDSVNSAGTILSFFEAVAVVGGAVVAIGGYVLRNSIQREIEENRDFVRRTEEAFEKRLDESRRFQQEIEDEIRDILAQTRREIDGVKQQAHDTARALSLLVLAEQQVRAHNFGVALEILQQVNALEPDNPAANYLMGYIYTARKELNQAITYLQHALENQPDFAPARAALGLALSRRGDELRKTDRDAALLQWVEAERHLRNALQRDPHLLDADGESYYGTLGGLHRRRKHYQDAIEAYEQARHITPDASYPVANVAKLYLHEEQLAQARDAYEQVRRMAEQRLANDPGNYWARADLIEALLVLGQPDGAQAALGVLLDATPERGTLGAIADGLRFLSNAPLAIDGLPLIIERLEAAIASPGPSENHDDT